MKRLFLFVPFFYVISASAGFDWTVEHLCRQYPAEIERLITALDTDYPGLEDVRKSVDRGDKPAACRQLLRYYQQGRSGNWLRNSIKPGSSAVVSKADKLVNDYFEAFDFAGRVPRLPEGRKDWTTYGPNDSLEYNALLLRHTYFLTLMEAWRATSDGRYISYMDRDLKDWITAAQMPAQREYYPQWGAGLECGLRLKTWTAVFFALMDCGELTDAARLLMLSSIPQQADFIMNLGSFRANHVVAEMYGLTQAALCFPEYKDASKWLNYAFEQMVKQTTDQVYPDGVQKELSSHYHKETLAMFDQYNGLLKRAGTDALPQLHAVTCRMGDYLAYAMNPAGYLPMNNDSYHHSMADAALKKAEDCGRRDWSYIASGGRSGTRPDGYASIIFPWARHVFMRSGWDANAHYAFFDGGPWGIAHQHYDKLHVSIFACGRDLLVDSGVFTYKGYYGTDPWRNYFISSAAHNTILVDGVGQGSSPKEYGEPMPAADYLITPEYDYAVASFTDGYRGVMDQESIEGTATHTRKLLYIKNSCWLVLDEIKTDRPRRIQAIWHYNPDCTVEIQDRSVVSVDPGKGNLRITPVADIDWQIELVKGRSDPNEIQGWYSTDFNDKQPAFTAVYTTRITGSSALAWILMPASGEVPPTKAILISADPAGYKLKFDVAGGARQVSFTSDQGRPAEIRTVENLTP